MTLLAQADQDLAFPVFAGGNPSAKADQDFAVIVAQRLVPATIFTFADQDLCFAVAQRVVPFIQIVGQFRDILGSPISNGYLEVSLSANAQVSTNNSAQLTMQSMRFPLDNNGNLSMFLWANDVLLPDNTFYNISGFTSTGVQFWRGQPKKMVILKGLGVQNIKNVLTD